MKRNSRLYPSLTSSSYLVLARRRELLRAQVKILREQNRRDLTIVDVGGHEKPYAAIFAGVASRHISIDLSHRDTDVCAIGEAIPFPSDSVDLVLCTQVLEHVEWPPTIIGEIRRILKPGGTAFISVPAVFPLHGGPYDNWRFMAGGLKVLLRDFTSVRVIAEGGTLSGFFRTTNMYLDTFTGRSWGKPFNWLLAHTLYPVFNLLGWYLDPVVHAGDTFAVNWLAIAVK